MMPLAMTCYSTNKEDDNEGRVMFQIARRSTILGDQSSPTLGGHDDVLHHRHATNLSSLRQWVLQAS
jgi:hypothetical protein